jgi:hypothetical protein
MRYTILTTILTIGILMGCASPPIEHEPEAVDKKVESFEETLNRVEELVRLKDFKAAKPILMELLKKNSKDIRLLRNTAFCLGGWLEFDGKNYVEVPGSGDYAPSLEDAEKRNKIYLDSAVSIWSYLLRGIELEGKKFSHEWWEAKFYTIYTRYRAGEIYPDYLDIADKLVGRLPLFYPEMGGPEWKPKFEYVENAIKEKRSSQSDSGFLWTSGNHPSAGRQCISEKC